MPTTDHEAIAPVVSISDAQRSPIASANWVDTVYHGIPLADHTFNPRRGDYLAFLGRISPEKGLDTAIRVAERTGLPLRIAGRMPLPHTNDPEALLSDEEKRERRRQHKRNRFLVALMSRSAIVLTFRHPK